MKPRHKRILAIVGGLAALGAATALVLTAFQENLVFFFTPSQVAANEAPQGRTFRIGGMVEKGSVQRSGIEVRFVVTDTAKSIPVVYSGALPDLFREGKGVVAQGQLGADGVFRAREVLAKHDENYMPPKPRTRWKRRKRLCRPNDPRTRTTRAVPCPGGRAGAGNLSIDQPGSAALARGAAQAQALLVAFAFGCLTYAFVNNDFSVQYVAMHSNSALPLHYRISGVWGGHEGSFLLWCLMLGAWMLAVAAFSAHLPEEMVARVLGVMGVLSAGFIAFMLFTSNPFDRLFPAPPDGRDLNPLLQDPGMVLHPPMLYMGYVGFSVAFAFAVAALLSGRLDAAWARWSRPWTTVAWVFLTLGIALGSGWAYYELGWGGWWFWDPVENASFMPWLVGTALIHSLAVTEKRGGFRSWTVLLAIVASR